MKLSSGSEIVVDLTQITQKELRFASKTGTDVTKSDEIIGKCVGMTADELGELNPIDYQRVAKAVFYAVTHIDFDDPKNSASESTTD